MKIIINERMPSINHLYYHRPPFGTKTLSVKAKSLRERIIKITHEQADEQKYNLKEWDGKLLKVRVEIYEDWWTKKHTVKKKDIANKEKFLIDSIMTGLGLDDSFIWEHIMCKIDSEDLKAVISIEKWTPRPQSAK